MDIANPREQYDNLIEERREEEVDAETFAVLGDNEAFSAGWVVSAVVLVETERVLLAYSSDGS